MIKASSSWAILRRAANAEAWALGRQQRNGFHVRRVVWGREMARAEKRDGEEIRRTILMIRQPKEGPDLFHVEAVDSVL